MIISTYESIIKQLTRGIRPRIQNSQELNSQLVQELSSNKIPAEPVLCILCHLAKPDSIFEPLLIDNLNAKHPIEIQIFTLEAIQKHVLDSRMLSGNRLTPNFLKKFNEYLERAPKKTMYFVVGIIENCGSQGIYFRRSLKNYNWGLLDALKREYRETITRLDGLEKRWQSFDK